MAKSQNVNLKGANGVFATMANTGHQNVQHSFDQIVTPVPIMFDPIPNTPARLENIPCAYVMVQNLVGNDPIYVGGLDDQSPYIDKNFVGDFRGTVVYPGVTLQFNVTNANLLQVVGTPYQVFNYKAYPNVTTVVNTNTESIPQIDFSKPTVVSTTPLDKATNVVTTTSISAILSKALDPATVSISTVLISPAVAGTVFIDTNNTRVGFNPAAALATSTTYTITLKGGKTGISDDTGPKNRLAADYSWSFTTIPTPDTTPPTVTSTVPVASATNVDTQTNITINFSESMDSTTLTSTTCRLLDASLALVASTLTISPDKKTVTLDPTPVLLNNTVYTIRVTTGVKDIAGNALAVQFQSTFTTITSPSVVSVSPVNAATNQSVSSIVTIVFSEAMDATTMNANNVKLLDASLLSVNCNYQLSVDQKTIIMTPVSSLLNSTTYTVRVTTGAKDLAGIALPSQFQSTFITIASVPPTVSSVTPANNATNIALDAVITVVFSIAMDVSTINNTNIQLLNNLNASLPCTVTLIADLKTVTVDPLTPLDFSIQYTVKVTTAVKSSAGVALATQFQSTFTTLARTYTQIYNVSGSDYNQLNNGGDLFEGELCNTSSSKLIGHVPRKITVTMNKSGSPSGPISCVIINTSSGSILKTIGATIDASTLTGSDKAYTFEDATNTVALAQNYAIAIKFTGGGSSDQVQIRRATSDAYDGSNSIRAKSVHSDGTTWFLDSAREFASTILE
jgi:methionine-rich copper-binding protein CopC